MKSRVKHGKSVSLEHEKEFSHLHLIVEDACVLVEKKKGIAEPFWKLNSHIFSWRVLRPFDAYLDLVADLGAELDWL